MAESGNTAAEIQPEPANGVSTNTGTVNAAAASSNPPSATVDKVPDNLICVRLLLINGQKTDLLFSPTDSIETVKSRIFSGWPSDWTGERPETVANLRVLLRGKFLEPTSTLLDSIFPVGETTTCHLLVKNGAVAQTTGSVTPNAAKAPSAGCRCTIL
ncbi:Ubiquitin-like protein 3 [Chytriomyces hyalinus]|nr:Ubiquitin-like protein 3 [Chytriomyces hyalinus]